MDMGIHLSQIKCMHVSITYIYNSAALDDDDNWVTQKENGASSIQGKLWMHAGVYLHGCKHHIFDSGLVVQKENDEQKGIGLCHMYVGITEKP